MIDIEKLKALREPKLDPAIKAGGWESTAEIITANAGKMGKTAVRKELQLSLEAGLLETKQFPTGIGGRPADYWRMKTQTRGIR